jgi:translation initiation factor IF-3
VIDGDGSQLGILPTGDALARAEELGLQLVEVNPKANPPVCKIMDYGRFKYENAKRERDTKKNKKSQDLKEVKFRPKTHDHDFDFKVKHARRFLEEGSKVRLLVQFRGREIVHPETGRAVLERVCKATADLATVVQMANLEGNRMSMIIAPKASKSGSSRTKKREPRPPRDPKPAEAAPPATAETPPAADADPAAPPTETPSDKTESAPV